MKEQTDGQLLRSYAEHRFEPAFGELVRRHVDFVYSAAFRMVRDPHLAEDVTQGVFVALAKSAPHLLDRSTLAGWLHKTAQNIAAQTVRTIERRRAREQEAITMNQLLSSQTESSWEQIAPHLDAALGELNEPDRDAVLLRYFEKKSAGEIGELLGVSEEAAQKRVSRAVERMREFFAKRGVTLDAVGLVVVISASAVQAAPVGLAVTISAATFAGAAVSPATVIAATKTIAMTTLQKAIITAALVAAAGTGIFEARQAAQMREQNQTLQQQQASLAEQNLQLQKERDGATNRLAGFLAENSRLKSNPNQTELLKLRGEVGMLRQRTNDLDKSQMEKRKLLSQAVTQSDLTNQESVEDHFILQQTHAVDAITKLLTAVKNYAAKNNGQNPVNFDELVSSGELEATNFAGNLGLGDFEFAKEGTVNQQGNKVILNLRVPIQRPGRPSVIVSGGITDGGLIQTEILNVGSE